MHIILDTNIIRKDFLLKSNHFTILLDYVFKTCSTIVIPRIVFQELISLYRKELIANLNEATKILTRIDIQLVETRRLNQNIEINFDEVTQTYKQYLTAQLGVFSLQIIDFKDSFLNEIIKRSIERIKPNSSNGEGFRDTVLWLSILDFLENNKFDKAVFISNNIKDFADESQTDLHPELMNDLQKQGLKLEYYKSLSDFTKEIALRIDFITNEWLNDNLDWDQLDKEALAVIEGINAAFFYEYYYRKNVNMYSLEKWGVISANFKRYIDNYFVYEQADSDIYKIEILLSGQTQIKFVDDNEQFVYNKANFYTSIYARVEKNKSIYFENGFFEEETGLDLN